MTRIATVLITGAAGDIGRRLQVLLAGVYPRLRLSDVKTPPDVAAEEIFVPADLADMAQVERAVAGVDAIVHLGGFSVEGPWETILSANIVGCYNLFEAARRHGVKRVVFASSNHAVGFYPRNRRIGMMRRSVRIPATASARRSVRPWPRSTRSNTGCA